MINTSVCEVLGISHPVVLAGMGGGTNAELVAAVSEAGGLGILACTWRTTDDVLAQIRQIRRLTDRPFGVNFVVPLMNDETFQACLAERIPVFSFFRGDPAAAVAQARASGARTLHQVTTIDEAEHACELGVDVLIAQGCEAGGHMGPLPLLSLLPEVVAVAGARPVLAAGSIVDGRGLAAMLCLGAAGVLMGTRFLATPECMISDAHKQAIVDAHLADTVASGVWDMIWGVPWEGVQLRTIRNEMTARWVGNEDQLALMIDEAREAYAQAVAIQNPAFIPLLAGQGAGRIHDLKPAGAIVREVSAEAEQVLRKLNRTIG